ncbi:hypothetical protein FGIG_10468 [Fasciola gigantica]|uniref:Uncharacterized protein n=1 Tax=Fasciola gigantica TaxID=46835 RepID=A0A504Y997_FASGI|nr:hypothetical protein FGIG_10468 [Fasciola gigantica]
MCAVGDNGQCATTRDCRAEVLKYHVEQVHKIGPGDRIIHNLNPAATQLDDFSIARPCCGAIGTLSTNKAAGASGLHPAIMKPLEAAIGETLDPRNDHASSRLKISRGCSYS